MAGRKIKKKNNNSIKIQNLLIEMSRFCFVGKTSAKKGLTIFCD
jgi:hypothetical protein